MNDSEKFVNGLLEQVTSLKTIYDKHIRDNDELLPHVLMGAVTRFAIAESSKPQSRELVTLLRYLEDGLQKGSEEITELIVVSFVENLVGEKIATESLKPLMGPLLRSEVAQICGE